VSCEKDSFGFLPDREPLDFADGRFEPLGDIDQSIEDAQSATNKDGFYYPHETRYTTSSDGMKDRKCSPCPPTV
jgi:hypothetical protein